MSSPSRLKDLSTKIAQFRDRILRTDSKSPDRFPVVRPLFHQTLNRNNVQVEANRFYCRTRAHLDLERASSIPAITVGDAANSQDTPATSNTRQAREKHGAACFGATLDELCVVRQTPTSGLSKGESEEDWVQDWEEVRSALKRAEKRRGLEIVAGTSLDEGWKHDSGYCEYSNAMAWMALQDAKEEMEKKEQQEEEEEAKAERETETEREEARVRAQRNIDESRMRIGDGDVWWK
jgi:hypothetical protein